MHRPRINWRQMPDEIARLRTLRQLSYEGYEVVDGRQFAWKGDEIVDVPGFKRRAWTFSERGERIWSIADRLQNEMSEGGRVQRTDRRRRGSSWFGATLKRPRVDATWRLEVILSCPAKFDSEVDVLVFLTWYYPPTGFNPAVPHRE